MTRRKRSKEEGHATSAAEGGEAELAAWRRSRPDHRTAEGLPQAVPGFLSGTITVGGLTRQASHGDIFLFQHEDTWRLGLFHRQGKHLRLAFRLPAVPPIALVEKDLAAAGVMVLVLRDFRAT